MKHRFGAAVRFLDPKDIEEKLEKRLGRLHARQRLGIERDHEAQIFGQGLSFFLIENVLFSPMLIEGLLRLSGLYWRGRRNAAEFRLRRNEIVSHRVPTAFDGFRILHLSDLHADMSQQAMTRIVDLLPSLEYDLCVLTGDYRGKTFGPFSQSLAGIARLREALKGPVYGVLGNHDTIRMVPDLEGMGIRMLLNECVVIERGGQRIHLAGIDDAYFFRQYRESRGRSSARRVLDSFVPHTGNLPAGRACRIRSAVERAHARRTDLPARRHPHHTRFRPAEIFRLGRLEIQRHGRLHFGRRRLIRGACPFQLSAGDHTSSPPFNRAKPDLNKAGPGS